jgi:hypothetical protein
VSQADCVEYVNRNVIPDEKPSPTAGAMRLSSMRAVQNGTRSASVLAIVVRILIPALTAGVARKLFSHLVALIV